MLSVPICDISGKCSFLPRIFTDLHGFGYMLSVPICVISGKCSFLPRISQIFTDLVTCYPCPFVTSVGNIFPPTDFTDLVTCYPCPFVSSVGIFFSHGFHGFGYMLSVPICVISGNIFLPRIFTDLHGFVFLVAANALGIGAASFWSVSGKRYSGKPDGFAGTPSFLKFRV